MALALLGMATRGCPGSRHRYWGYLSPKLLSTGAVSSAGCTWVGKTHPPQTHPQTPSRRWESWAWAKLWWAGSDVGEKGGWAWSVRGAARVRPWTPTPQRRLSSPQIEGAVWSGGLQRRSSVAGSLRSRTSLGICLSLESDRWMNKVCLGHCQGRGRRGQASRRGGAQR